MTAQRLWQQRKGSRSKSCSLFLLRGEGGSSGSSGLPGGSGVSGRSEVWEAELLVKQKWSKISL